LKADRIEGSRLHIGLVFPSPIPPRLVKEFYAVVPDGVDLTTVTLTVTHLGDDHIREAGKGIEQACKQLAAYDVDLVYFLGVPPIVLQGPGFHRVLADRMAQACGLPAITDLCGVLEAMRQLNLRKIALATPFEQVVNDRIKAYLEAEGIAVTGAGCLRMSRNADIRRLPVSIEYDLARKTFLESSPRADGIYIACGSWGSIQNVPRLEHELDTTVVSWMNAFMWSSMRRASVRDRIEGFGKLLAHL
jgi:maleate isomerase